MLALRRGTRRHSSRGRGLVCGVRLSRFGQPCDQRLTPMPSINDFRYGYGGSDYFSTTEALDEFHHLPIILKHSRRIMELTPSVVAQELLCPRESPTHLQHSKGRGIGSLATFHLLLSTWMGSWFIEASK